MSGCCKLGGRPSKALPTRIKSNFPLIGDSHSASVHSPRKCLAIHITKDFWEMGCPGLGSECLQTGLYLPKTKMNSFNLLFIDTRTNLFINTADSKRKVGWSLKIP